jgi:acetyl-CoA acetyltransferase
MALTGPVVISYGSSPYEKHGPHGLLWHLWIAARACLDRAGVPKSEVDGLALASFSYSPGNAVTLAEHFGMRLRWAEQGIFGGASGVVALRRAADAIRAGRARVILCLAGDVFTVTSHDAMLDLFTPAIRDHLAPHGFGGANGLFALVQREHSHRYGTTRAQLGRIAVTQRAHAALNPNALFREPLTLEEYLEARPIAEPLHLFDCVLPCSGAEAVLVADAEFGEASGRPPVEVAASRELHNAHPELSLSLPAGFELYADDLFAEAEVDRSDVDFVELYDDYPIMVAIQLEAYGFCGEGGSGRFLDASDISIRGSLPVNTGGGQLSCGQAGAGGGMIGVVEAVQQLQHEASERQVAGASIGLVSGFGLISYGKGLCAAGAILRRL